MSQREPYIDTAAYPPRPERRLAYSTTVLAWLGLAALGWLAFLGLGALIAILF